MFNKCNYIYSLIDSLDISERDKLNLCLEINYLINLIMFGDEKRPVSVNLQHDNLMINDIRSLHDLTRKAYKQGENNV